MHNEIELAAWNRRTTFEFFRDFEDPYFNMTAPVDVTELHLFCKENGFSFALAALFHSQLSANSIREFRLRLKDDRVIEFDRVHATQTILNDDETFSFCYFEMKPTIAEFNSSGREAVEKYKRSKTFDVETHRIDLIYYSAIPWVSFTSFKHASRFNNRQTVPRIVFGKMYDDGTRRKMPISVEVHHAMMDGLHVGKYFEKLQNDISRL